MAKLAKHSGTLNLLAVKLGVGAEEKVVSKAAEYERRLQMKSTASCNISDTGKAVICLELAAKTLGVEFDTKTAIKYSGLKPSLYTNNKKVLENLLELNGDNLTVPLLCAQLHCDTVQELAQTVLEHFQKTSKMEIDLSMPQYICMAVHQACRIKKLKVSKSKLVERSRLKPGQWSKMEAEWTKLVDLHFSVQKKKAKPASKLADEEEPEKMDIDYPDKKADEDAEPQIEPYEQWKCRILAAAYAALGVTEVTDNDKQMINEPKQATDKLSLTKRHNQITAKHTQITDKPSEVTDKNKRVTDEPNRREKLNHVPDSPKSVTHGKQKQMPEKHKQVTDDHKNNQITENKEIEQNEVGAKHDKKTDKQVTPVKTYGNKKKNTRVDDAETIDIQFEKTGPSPNVDQRRKIGQSQNVDQKSKIDQIAQPVVQIARDVDKEAKQVDSDNQRKTMLFLGELSSLARRSPRKTPQKYEPYRSPRKAKGIRLLFPSD